MDVDAALEAVLPIRRYRNLLRFVGICLSSNTSLRQKFARQTMIVIIQALGIAKGRESVLSLDQRGRLVAHRERQVLFSAKVAMPARKCQKRSDHKSLDQGHFTHPPSDPPSQMSYGTTGAQSSRLPVNSSQTLQRNQREQTHFMSHPRTSITETQGAIETHQR